MTFNLSRCYILTISQNNKINTFLYQLCGCVLSKVPNCKYLGVTLSEDLQRATHISNICKSASSSLGSLLRNLRKCMHVRLSSESWHACFALVHSELEYSCTVWNPHLTNDKYLQAGIQQRGARFEFVLQDHLRDSSATLMLEKLGLDSLETRYRNARVILFNRINCRW